MCSRRILYWLSTQNRKSGLVESQVILQVQLCLDHLLQVQHDRMVQRLRRLHDTQEIGGSILLRSLARSQVQESGLRDFLKSEADP